MQLLNVFEMFCESKFNFIAKEIILLLVQFWYLLLKLLFPFDKLIYLILNTTCYTANLFKIFGEVCLQIIQANKVGSTSTKTWTFVLTLPTTSGCLRFLKGLFIADLLLHLYQIDLIGNDLCVLMM